MSGALVPQDSRGEESRINHPPFIALPQERRIDTSDIEGLGLFGERSALVDKVAPELHKKREKREPFQVSRRTFLAASGILGGLLAVSPRSILAAETETDLRAKYLRETTDRRRKEIAELEADKIFQFVKGRRNLRVTINGKVFMFDYEDWKVDPKLLHDVDIGIQHPGQNFGFGNTEWDRYCRYMGEAGRFTHDRMNFKDYVKLVSQPDYYNSLDEDKFLVRQTENNAFVFDQVVHPASPERIFDGHQKDIKEGPHGEFIVTYPLQQGSNLGEAALSTLWEVNEALQLDKTYPVLQSVSSI